MDSPSRRQKLLWSPLEHTPTDPQAATASAGGKRLLLPSGPGLLDWRKTPSLVLLCTRASCWTAETPLEVAAYLPVDPSFVLLVHALLQLPPQAGQVQLGRYEWCFRSDPDASPVSRQSVTNLHRMHRPPVLRVAALHLSVELPDVLKTRPHCGVR